MQTLKAIYDHGKLVDNKFLQVDLKQTSHNIQHQFGFAWFLKLFHIGRSIEAFDPQCSPVVYLTSYLPD